VIYLTGLLADDAFHVTYMMGDKSPNVYKEVPPHLRTVPWADIRPRTAIGGGATSLWGGISQDYDKFEIPLRGSSATPPIDWTPSDWKECEGIGRSECYYREWKREQWLKEQERIREEQRKRGRNLREEISQFNRWLAKQKKDEEL